MGFLDRESPPLPNAGSENRILDRKPRNVRCRLADQIRKGAMHSAGTTEKWCQHIQGVRTWPISRTGIFSNLPSNILSGLNSWAYVNPMSWEGQRKTIETYVVSPNCWIAVGGDRVDHDMVVWGKGVFAIPDSGRFQTVYGSSCGRRLDAEDLSQDRNGIWHLGDVIQGDGLVPKNLVDFRP